MLIAEMARSRAVLAVLPVVLLVLILTSARGAAAQDNVSVQWIRLFMQLFCSTTGITFESSILMATLNLAQWHALIALKRTGGCTTEEAVVAYASRTVLQNYFPFSSDVLIDPLLDRQLEDLQLTATQKRLAKRLGKGVAKRLIDKRSPLREFLVQEVRNAIKTRQDRPGLFGYVPGTPHNETAPLVTHYYSLEQPFVLPNAVDFVKEYLGDLKPPKVPSNAWDAAYDSLVNLGRIDWPGRTAAMNRTADLFSCSKEEVSFTTVGCNSDMFWINAAINSVPKKTPLYDVVTLLAKMSVAMHETQIVVMTMKDGYWFWRPADAFRTGDERHAPFPNWTPWAYTFFDPEYPSGTVAIFSTGATVLQSFFGKKIVPFSIEGSGVFGANCVHTPGAPIGTRRYDSIHAAVEESILGRIYSGAHYNSSTRDGEIVGATVANYVLNNWAKSTPSGVLPDTEHLNIFVELPKEQRQFLPVHYEV